MKFDRSKLVSNQGPHWCQTFLLTAIAALILVSVTAEAAGGRQFIAPDAPATRGHQKMSADLTGFPLNADGTVSVIIQFNQTPQARHFDDMSAQGGRLKFSLSRINGAAYRIPVRMLVWLQNHPDVAYVSPDRPNKVAANSPDEDIPAVMGDVAQQQYGLNGTGVGVAVIDSGVFNHDDLKNATGTASRIVYSESFIPGDPSTNDAYGHGTHVAGILAGNGHDSTNGYSIKYVGVAPNANIINLRVLDANGVGTDSQVIAAIQRAIQLKNTYNIRVINLSLGRNIYESYKLDPVCQAVEAAWQSGIVVVVAAGNAGRNDDFGTDGYATIMAPGNDPNVITVGATKTNGSSSRLDDTVASYSSKGPTLLDHVVKPDLVAPGNRIVSLSAPGSTLVKSLTGLNIQPITVCVLGLCTTGPSGKYTRLSGTSMATPIVSGAAALMLQKDPTLTPDTIKARMMKTAWKGYPVNSWAYDVLGHGHFSQYDIFTIGAGYLDIYAALKSNDVVNGGASSPVVSFNAVTGKATLSNSQSITWGNSIIWGSSIIWGNSIVWGGDAVLSDSIVWGDSIIWGQTGMAGSSIIWGNSIGWSGESINGLSAGEDGEN
jgi:serine protease AprX